MPKKRKSTKSDLSLGKVQEPSHYESDEASYVKTESKKKVQKKKKREGYEILDGITHEVHVEYGDRSIKQKSDALRDKKGNYKKGTEDGLWEFYDEEGNLIETKELKDGKLIK